MRKDFGTLPTKAYASKEKALGVVETIQARLPGWQVTAEPSPDKPGSWGVRATQDLQDINEESCESVGRSRFAWMKANGMIYLPEDA